MRKVLALSSLISWFLARPAILAFAVWMSIVLDPAHAEESAILFAAGDIARCPNPGAEQTAKLMDELPGTVIAVGDLAYERGAAAEFRDCYEPTWGRHKDRTWPVPGNHEYGTPGADGYFSYWGSRAGEPGKGFYSFQVGAWHVIALNSNIDAEPGSEQERWLRRDLASTQARCILAFWHHPIFSSGLHGPAEKMLSIYEVLYESGATVLIVGHDHNYERFAPQDPAGHLDTKRGIRSFTAGTGGALLRPLKYPKRNSEAWHADSWGVLKLTLHPDRYEWAFLSVKGYTLDSAGDDCVERPSQ